MIQLREQYWCMEVPEDAWVWIPENFKTDFVVSMGYLVYPKAGKKKWLSLPGMSGIKLPGLDYNERIKAAIKLPPGTWEIVCMTKAVARDHASEIVEQDGEGFRDYSGQFHHDIPFPDPLPSLASLLTTKGCDTKLNWLILKKQ
jgi:hypothetical protein